MGTSARRELRRLDVRLAVDRLRVRRARLQLDASLRRTAARPATLGAAFVAGVLVTAVLGRRTGPSRRAAGSSRKRSLVAFLQLAGTALRAWSRSATARELLSPLLASLVPGRRGA